MLDYGVLSISLSPLSAHEFEYCRFDGSDILPRQFALWVPLDTKTGSGFGCERETGKHFSASG